MATLYDHKQRLASVQRSINTLKRDLNRYEDELLQLEWTIERLTGQDELRQQYAAALEGLSLDQDKLKQLGYTDGQIKAWNKALAYITGKKWSYSDKYNINDSTSGYNANSMKRLVSEHYFTEEYQHGFRSSSGSYYHRITMKGIRFLMDNTIGEDKEQSTLDVKSKQD